MPIVRALEKQSVAAPVTGRETPLARRLIEPSAVVRKIKQRNLAGVERGAPRLDKLAGNDAQVPSANTQNWVGTVVGGQPGVGGRVLVARCVSLDIRALNEKRWLAGAKIVSLHCTGLEVVKEAFGREDSIPVLQRNTALCKDFAGGLIETAAIGDDEGTFALLLERNAETVVQDDPSLVEFVVELAQLKRLDLPQRLARRRWFSRPNDAWPSDKQREKKTNPARMHQRALS